MIFKKIFTFFLVICLVSSFAFSACAVDIDGLMGEAAWKSAYKTTLFTSSEVANCNIKSAVLTIIEDPKSNRLLFGFKVKLSDSIENSLNYGVAVSLNSSEFIVVQQDSVSDYDTDIFGVEYGIEATGDDAFCAEVAVGLKYGLNTAEDIKVRVIDANGSPSTVFDVDYFIQSELTESEKTTFKSENVQTVAATASEADKKTAINNIATTKSPSTKNTTIKSIKTTKQKTTKKIVTEKTVSVYITQPESSPEIKLSVFDDNNESTTSLNIKQVNFYKNTFKILVIVIILLALCVCVAVNVIREKKKNGN